MKAIGLLTEDFTVYHDVIKALRARKIPFVSLNFGDPIPSNIGVIITTEREVGDVEFDSVVVVHDYPKEKRGLIQEVESAIDSAIGLLHGGIRCIVIGIDPGIHPGIAILADDHLLNTYRLPDTEAISSLVRYVKRYYNGVIQARIGNGAPTERNRAVQILMDEDIQVFIVDETGTSKRDHQDVSAAIEIARRCPVIRRVYKRKK